MQRVLRSSKLLMIVLIIATILVMVSSFQSVRCDETNYDDDGDVIMMDAFDEPSSAEKPLGLDLNEAEDQVDTKLFL